MLPDGLNAPRIPAKCKETRREERKVAQEIAMSFKDRSDAGRKLALALRDYKNQQPVVLALPRGGVPVATKVAAALDAPLDLILVRKIGVPYQPELAMGAVVDGDKPLVVRNEDVIRLCRHRRFPARGLKARGRFSTLSLPVRNRATMVSRTPKCPIEVSSAPVVWFQPGLFVASNLT
jgi:Phosphoribosyl transferase domain